jgi:ribosomal-protein-alanine N-acetyltransferase
MSPCPRLLDRIMAVMEAAFDPAYGEAWNRRQVADALAMPSTHALVVDAAGDPIPGDPAKSRGVPPAGFVLTRKAADEEELLLIAVLPEHRRRGLGEALIAQLFDEARARGTVSVFLEMRRGNPAIHLYEKVGFRPIGKRPDYYRLANGSRVDAITFAASI